MVGVGILTAVTMTPSPAPRRVQPQGQQAKGMREKAWWLMRERRKFTINTLLETLADGSERDAKGNLFQYIRRLEGAGVLARSAQRLRGDSRTTSHGHVIWILVRDVGRMAPVWRTVQQVLWDPNSQSVVLPETSTVSAVVTATGGTA